MKKILIIGDTVAPYHPLHCIFPIHKALGEEKLTFTNDYDYFTKLNEFDLLICFIDAWFTTADEVKKAVSVGDLPCYNEALVKMVNNEQAKALVNYIENGGRVLSIHTGISLQKTPALETIHGAKFLDHPPYCEIVVNVVKGHRLTQGITDFTINDEPYHFEGYEGLDIFATYEYEGKTIPAGWEKECGKGRFIYLMPGHDEAVFENEEYLKLIKRCVEDMV